MAVPKFQLRTSYTPKKDDYVVLPYINGRRACFPKSLLPKGLKTTVKAPDKKGSSRTVFSGKAGGVDLIARAVRLDADYSDRSTEIKKAVARGIKAAKEEGCKRVVVLVDGKRSDLATAAHEGALLGGYSYDQMLSDKPKPAPVMVVAADAKASALKKIIRDRSKLFDCVNFARDVQNGPPNLIKPPTLADEFRKKGKASGLKVTVWDEKRLKRERCGGIIAVGQGSAAKPRLVIGEYNPPKAKQHLALVGKGVTLDSGGYCLKVGGTGQIGMKLDMCGAAVMFSAACAIAKLKLPIRVTVLTPLVENAVSGEAYHSGTIFTSRAGRTVEVLSTDGEGRLILVDAITIAAERKPDWIVDAATLTGSVVVALGEDMAGVLGTDRNFTRQLIRSGADEGEMFWELPLHMPYMEGFDGTISDFKNGAKQKGAGTIKGALFLRKWVPDDIPWAHCDIVGPSMKDDPLGHLGKGAKGFGVKTMFALARKLSEAK